MPQTPLFNSDDLSAWLRQPVSEESAGITEKVVWGWLRPILGLTERPGLCSDELAAWALELGGIAYSNPEGLSSVALESEGSMEYSSERRDEILRAVAGGGVTAPGAALSPQGSFPTAPAYPDPAERCWG